MRHWQLTEQAKKLKEIVDEHDQNYEDKPSEVEHLASCVGSDSFCYALYEGGGVKPEDWVTGEDLEKLKAAIELVGDFKELVESLADVY